MKDLSIENKYNKKMWSYHKDIYDALKDAHAAIIMTEWDIYKKLDWKTIVSIVKKPFWVFDSRLVLDPKMISDLGINLWQLGYGKNS